MLADQLRRLPTFEAQTDSVPRSPGDPGIRGGERLTLGDLSARLEQAEILDPRTIQTPGAAIVLPWGNELVRMFRTGVERAFEARGYDQYDFPYVAPESAYAPAIAAFPEVQQLLYVADREGLDRGTSRGVLSPTGESIVYQFWSRHVRRTGDLPLRLYRNARYFRPVPSGSSRAGRSVLKPLEAPDVYEFHAAVASEAEVGGELDQAIAMVSEVIRGWHVPALWSVRPPWTNNGRLYRAAYGADTLLPSGDTVQVGVVYDQGRAYSRAFDIRLRDERPQSHPLHITGCVTRRLVLAHVFQADASGELALHPDVAPVQVVVRGDAPEAEALAGALRQAGLRVRVVIASGRNIATQERRWARRGVPVQALVQAARHPSDPLRIVLRDFRGVEIDLRCESAVRLGEMIKPIIDLLVAAARAHDEHLAHQWARVCESLDEARDLVTAGGVGVIGLDATREAVLLVESQLPGEVLGLVSAAMPVACLATGLPVESYAVVGGRV